ncbi:hypothetical protein SPONN_1459 [uncultured Candidatus Thioglobus sp.]|nr:hypothetical protein SPONN_1459 [uncultured Candidatus Thioglobus sp.]
MRIDLSRLHSVWNCYFRYEGCDLRIDLSRLHCTISLKTSRSVVICG